MNTNLDFWIIQNVSMLQLQELKLYWWSLGIHTYYPWINGGKNFWNMFLSMVKKPLQFHTIQKKFLIWISRSFKKGASDNTTISYFDQSFWFSGLWLNLARNLGRSGQYKSWRTERGHVILFFLILNSAYTLV